MVEHQPSKLIVAGSSPVCRSSLLTCADIGMETIGFCCAGVAELADAPGLGPGEATRGGSSPFARTRCFVLFV